LRPDWWKLPPVVDDQAWAAVAESIRRNDPQCGGAVVLGYERSQDELFAAFASSLRSGCAIGFAIGRSVWQQPTDDWFNGSLSDRDVQEQIASRYRSILDGWMRLEAP
jgi:5-dehydro-2-deoxygluconokinase